MSDRLESMAEAFERIRLELVAARNRRREAEAKIEDLQDQLARASRAIYGFETMDEEYARTRKDAYRLRKLERVLAGAKSYELKRCGLYVYFTLEGEHTDLRSAIDAYKENS